MSISSASLSGSFTRMCSRQYFACRPIWTLSLTFEIIMYLLIDQYVWVSFAEHFTYSRTVRIIVDGQVVERRQIISSRDYEVSPSDHCANLCSLRRGAAVCARQKKLEKFLEFAGQICFPLIVRRTREDGCQNVLDVCEKIWISRYCLLYCNELAIAVARLTRDFEITSNIKCVQVFMRQRDPRRSSVVKRRTCFLWHNQYFQLDVYCQPCDERYVLVMSFYFPRTTIAFDLVRLRRGKT